MKKKIVFLILGGVGSALYFASKFIQRNSTISNNYNNIGSENKGKFNIGSENVGNFNIGGNNLGSQNLGDGNVGNKNFGNFNSGDKNYGFYNIGKNTFGCFNTKKSPIYLFNKRSNMTIDKWMSSEAYEILLDMPTEESIALRQAWFDRLSDKSKNIIKNIDNFNDKIFERITGINVNNNVFDNSETATTPLLASYKDVENEDESYFQSSELAFETAYIVENNYPDEH